jgi:anti-sigma-K factor RskA
VSQSDLHPPDDLLALHAAGDRLPDAMSRHIDRCPRCLNELTQWQKLVTSAHATTRGDTPQPPPAHVWEGISRELALTAEAAPSTGPEPAVVVPIARARRWSTSFVVAASVAGLLVGGAATLGADTLMDNGDPAPVAAPTAVAQTQLVALPDHRGQGEAEIVETAAGTELIVDVSGLSGGDTSDGFFEVWLIDPDTLQMVGLGALTNDSGRFLVPDGLDLSQYRLVDVSLEPFDGDPVHSQDSVVRGELAT